MRRGGRATTRRDRAPPTRGGGRTAETRGSPSRAPPPFRRRGGPSRRWYPRRYRGRAPSARRSTGNQDVRGHRAHAEAEVAGGGLGEVDDALVVAVRPAVVHEHD